MAIPASPPQNKVTDKGDIIIEPNGMCALRAMGRGVHDGLAFGNPTDQHVKKTSYGSAGDSKEDIKEHAHNHVVPLFLLLLSVFPAPIVRNIILVWVNPEFVRFPIVVYISRSIHNHRLLR